MALDLKNLRQDAGSTSISRRRASRQQNFESANYSPASRGSTDCSISRGRTRRREQLHRRQGRQGENDAHRGAHDASTPSALVVHAQADDLKTDPSKAIPAIESPAAWSHRPCRPGKRARVSRRIRTGARSTIARTFVLERRPAIGVPRLRRLVRVARDAPLRRARESAPSTTLIVPPEIAGRLQ